MVINITNHQNTTSTENEFSFEFVVPSDSSRISIQETKISANPNNMVQSSPPTFVISIGKINK